MRLLTLFLVFLHFTINGQCDVAITGVDLNTYEVTIEVINSAGCLHNWWNYLKGITNTNWISSSEPINPDNELIEILTKRLGSPAVHIGMVMLY